MQREFVFVGGPIDGQRKCVELNNRDEPPLYFRIDVWDKPLTMVAFKTPDDVLSLRVTLYDYRLMVMLDSDGKRIMFYAGQDVYCVLARILDGYKR